MSYSPRALTVATSIVTLTMRIPSNDLHEAHHAEADEASSGEVARPKCAEGEARDEACRGGQVAVPQRAEVEARGEACRGGQVAVPQRAEVEAVIASWTAQRTAA